MSAVYNPESDIMAEIERLELEARDIRRRVEHAAHEADKRVLNRQLEELKQQIEHPAVAAAVNRDAADDIGSLRSDRGDPGRGVSSFFAVRGAVILARDAPRMIVPILILAARELRPLVGAHVRDDPHRAAARASSTSPGTARSTRTPTRSAAASRSSSASRCRCSRLAVRATSRAT